MIIIIRLQIFQAFKLRRTEISEVYGNSLVCWFFLLLDWLTEREFGKGSERNKDKDDFGLRFYFVDSHYFLEGRYSPEAVKVCHFWSLQGVQKQHAEFPFWHQNFGESFFFWAYLKGSCGLRHSGGLTFCVLLFTFNSHKYNSRIFGNSFLFKIYLKKLKHSTRPYH